MTNIETIRAALLGIVSKTEREEALKALVEVDFRISVLCEALNSMSHWNGQSVGECVSDAENTIRKLRKDNVNDKR